MFMWILRDLTKQVKIFKYKDIRSKGCRNSNLTASFRTKELIKQSRNQHKDKSIGEPNSKI